ncbi:hypothetical protein K1720_00710 [Thermococcus argininiproducens]|uniref:Uncharacterized protein n=1 Tax=Thermococcus argininiproducens TaxID=2866384 RepID=A0A9E7MA97_9EURY|nr:hypothetical protein [Thermococcus argininiproducens]USH00044.1 hypothetical protein K1720_00710 [Thermococcus argininiproducens]
MFESILKKLNEVNAPVIGKSKVPAAGIKAFEAILKYKGFKEWNEAVKIALSEFLRYNNGNEETLQEFKEILEREFSGFTRARIIKTKAKALKALWEAEAKALFGPVKRTKWISIRVTEEEYNRVLEEATKEGLDISNYIRKKLGLSYGV